jgi:hypothetical protein
VIFLIKFLVASSSFVDLLKAHNGHQTAAFAVNGGEEMLTGSPLYGNSGKKFTI